MTAQLYRINKYDHDVESNDGSWKHYTSFDKCKELFSSMSYSDITPDNNGDCTIIPYASGSAYGGTTVELSNFQCIKEDYSQYVLELYGGYVSFGLLVKLSDVESIPELKELFNDLDNYPLYSEDHFAQLEWELLNQSWEAWVKWDFGRLLSDNNIEVEDDNQEQLFWDSLCLANDNGDAEPIYEDIGSPFIRLEELLPYIKDIMKG